MYILILEILPQSGRTTNFSEEKKLLLAELGKKFPEVENERNDSQ